MLQIEVSFINQLIPVMQVAVLFYVLSGAYSVMQYRLLETDQVIPEFIVYKHRSPVKIDHDILNWKHHCSS